MQGKKRYLAITLSLAEFFDEKEETTVVEKVAFLLRLSICDNNNNNNDGPVSQAPKTYMTNILNHKNFIFDFSWMFQRLNVTTN